MATIRQAEEDRRPQKRKAINRRCRSSYGSSMSAPTIFCALLAMACSAAAFFAAPPKFAPRLQHMTAQDGDAGHVSVQERIDFVRYWLLEDGSSDVLQRLVRRGAERPDTELRGVSDMPRVPGCASTVHLRVDAEDDGTISLLAVSDALVGRGLVAVLRDVLDGISAEQALELEPETFADALGIRHALTSGRNDGLANMIKLAQEQVREQTEKQVEKDVPSEAAQQIMGTAAHKQPSVALLLSGGVDSSVALHMLLQKGYNVTAYYLKIWLEDEVAHLADACPWEDDLAVCQEVCAHAGGVPLVSVSLQSEYKQRVMDHTLKEAASGRTPNPDVLCNSRIKFGCFLDYVRDKHDLVASGHYARVQDGRLFRAPDPVKDQSYFLCALSKEQLDKVLFPIGHLEKHEVRELADRLGLPNRNRPDSQGLCFLGKLKFSDFVEAHLGTNPGPILTAERPRERIGTHHGLWFHTIGQRRGLGPFLEPLATSRGPWYVVVKDPEQNVVYASNRYEDDVLTRARSELYVEDVHWISEAHPGRTRFDMKIRHGPRIASGTYDRSTGKVVLDAKDGGLAPGQYVAFYEPGGTECYGGGIISERHWVEFVSGEVVESQVQ